MATEDVAGGDAERQPLLAPQASEQETVHSSRNETPKTRTVSLVIKFTLALTGEDF